MSNGSLNPSAPAWAFILSGTSLMCTTGIIVGIDHFVFARWFPSMLYIASVGAVCVASGVAIFIAAYRRGRLS